MNEPKPSLKPPPDDARRLDSFPSHVVPTDKALYRVVRKGRIPWWFGNSMDGRFDLEAPHGTCYVAQEDLAALLEVIGSGPVTHNFLAARRLRMLFLPKPWDIADTCSRSATRFGITAEIGIGLPYDVSQAWAARLSEAGSDGVSYWLRHDPGRARGYALFAEAGEKTRWRRGRERMITGRLLVRLRLEYGVEIHDRPHSNQITFVT